jgi:translation elongation factor EF-4
MFGTVVYKDRDDLISNPTEFPNVIDTASKVKEVQEPIVKASIIVPEGLYSRFFSNVFDVTKMPDYLGDMMELCFSHRAENVDHRYLDAGDGSSSRIILTCTLPLSEIVTDFFDQLKSRSSGFASFECVFELCNIAS